MEILENVLAVCGSSSQVVLIDLNQMEIIRKFRAENDGFNCSCILNSSHLLFANWDSSVWSLKCNSEGENNDWEWKTLVLMCSEHSYLSCMERADNAALLKFNAVTSQPITLFCTGSKDGFVSLYSLR